MKFFAPLIALVAITAVQADECKQTQLLQFVSNAMKCVQASGVDVTNFAAMTPADMTKACTFPDCKSLFTEIGSSGLTCTLGGHSATEVGQQCSAPATTTPTMTTAGPSTGPSTGPTTGPTPAPSAC